MFLSEKKLQKEYKMLLSHFLANFTSDCFVGRAQVSGSEPDFVILEMFLGGEKTCFRQNHEKHFQFLNDFTSDHFVQCGYVAGNFHFLLKKLHFG